MVDPELKYIMLDIDGVINSERDFFEWKYYDRVDQTHNGGKVISRGCLAYLERIIDDTGAMIIISSNWRRHLSIDEIYDVMATNGFRKPRSVIHDEFPSYKFSSSRGGEIKEFVDTHGLTKFVILDDINEGLSNHFVAWDGDDWIENQPDANWVRTNPMVGLDGNDAAAAIRILGLTTEAQVEAEKTQKSLDMLVSCMI